MAARVSPGHWGKDVANAESFFTGDVTPMMRQYNEIKSRHQDAILFYRLGDFYEMFNDDARIAARELELTLTARNRGAAEAVPLAGVPYHAAEGYISRLVARGYKVVICEQVEDPKQAKGLVKREVVRVVTPGTSLLNDTMAMRDNNFLMAIATDHRARSVGIAYVDVTTGEFCATDFEGSRAGFEALAEMVRVRPAELVLSPDLAGSRIETVARETMGIQVRTMEFPDPTEGARTTVEAFGVLSLDGFGLSGRDSAVSAVAGILGILEEHCLGGARVIDRITYYRSGDSMHLDAATLMNLEITETISDKQRKGSLLWVMDRTCTSMGARMLKGWLVKPMTSREAIVGRQERIERLVGGFGARQDLSEAFSGVYDMERILSKVSFGSVNARDLMMLRTSLEAVPPIRQILESGGAFSEVLARLGDFSQLFESISRTIRDDAPLTVREGGMIKGGCSPELDELKSIAFDGKDFLAGYEFEERERTGIKSLKVRYNKVFGYYIEVTNSNLENVPEGYIRKQTLSNCERFYTEELKEKEILILGAEDKIKALEYEIFRGIVEQVFEAVPVLKDCASALAEIDSTLSMAVVASDMGWVKPGIGDEGILDIREGRHPVVEKTLGPGEFVPNDTDLDMHGRQILLITGPNMAGKSTYIRQTAIIALLAHVGSFVPAFSARIDLLDRIFTRVGASDNLATGLSTFMVEMLETANILNHATSKSLVILDEIGRGTSTYDGISIAWAITEFLHSSSTLGAKTLFATHYHELTELSKRLDRLVNMNVLVREAEGSVTFLRKIVPGATDRSYGIEVARLAGLPKAVIERAREILVDLEQSNALDRTVTGQAVPSLRMQAGALHGRGVHIRESAVAREIVVPTVNFAAGETFEGDAAADQMSLFRENVDPVLDELLSLDLMKMSPLQAMNFLFYMQKRIRGEEPQAPLPVLRGRGSKSKFQESVTDLLNLKLFG